MNNFSERLEVVIKELGYSNPHDFATRGLGYESSEKIQRLFRKPEGEKAPKPSLEVLEDIAKKFATVDIKWLIAGIGDLGLGKNISMFSEDVVQYGKKDATPYYNINVFAGEKFSLTEKEYITGYITLPDMPACDCAITVYGDSMEPMIANGDIILCKEVQDKTQIHYGAVYLIITNELRVVKYIRKGDEGHIMLWSQNKHHDPFDVALAKVLKLFSVKAIVKKVGM